jgi:hypothetical protein
MKDSGFEVDALMVDTGNRNGSMMKLWNNEVVGGFHFSVRPFKRK